MPPDEITTGLQAICDVYPDSWTLSSCGLTAEQQSIPVLLSHRAYTHNTNATRILIISGLSGKESDLALANRLLQHILSDPRYHSSNLALSVIPDTNPSHTFDLSVPYPPDSGFFYHSDLPEMRYLWRYICWQAPDLVIEICEDTITSIESNNATKQVLTSSANTVPLLDENTLLWALGTGHPDKLNPICGIRLTCQPDNLISQLDELFLKLSYKERTTSELFAADIQDIRRSRPPLDVSSILAKVYGHELDPVNYTQGVGIAGRLRLHILDPSTESPVAGIIRLVEPYVSKEKEMFLTEPGGANLAGLIWSDELFKITADSRYKDLMIETANRYRQAPQGTAPYPCDPEFRTEDMFMAGTILGKAFQFTEDHAYIDILTEFLLNGRTQTETGLFWHCRSAPYFWGRGNGFAALGLSETLACLPENHAHKAEIIEMYRKLMGALLQVQKQSGMLPQVLDIPGSYEEFTATCMFGIAMSKGLRHGWLGSEYESSLYLAWQGVNERIDESGNIVDGCISTGVQHNVREYLDRQAIFGRDDRSGGMALWFGLELAELDR